LIILSQQEQNAKAEQALKYIIPPITVQLGNTVNFSKVAETGG